MHKMHNNMSAISCIMSVDRGRIIVYNKTIAREQARTPRGVKVRADTRPTERCNRRPARPRRLNPLKLKEVNSMSTHELNSTARDLMSVRAMIAELETEAEALTDKLKGAMVAAGTEVLQGDGWKATWKNVVSSRFDSKRFKADHGDLYGQYSRTTTSTRFVLSV